MAQRISRAKQTHPGRRRAVRPAAGGRARRAAAGRAARALPGLQRGLHRAAPAPTCTGADLTAEAIRLTRLLHRLLPDDGEVAGLLALMLLTDARRPARTDAGRRRWSRWPSRTASRWDAGADRRGRRAGHRDAARAAPVGPYQLQAAIAAVHDEAPTRRGDRLAADPRAVRAARADVARARWSTLNRAVAVAMVARAARPGSRCSAPLDGDDRLARTPPAATPSAPTCSSWPATPTAARAAYLRGGPADREPAGAALPPAPRRRTP